MITNIAFVDCETTHLDAEIGEAWEVAVILREQKNGRTTDTECVWQFAVDLATADPEALRIGRFRERHLVDPTWGAAWTGPGPIIPLSRESAIEAIVHVLSGAVLVGSNPGFDDRFLRKLLGPSAAQWHYRPYDIVQLAAAKIGAQAAGPLPWSSYVLSRAVGVEPPAEEAVHTALGDARWARDVHDAVMIRQKFGPTMEDRARHAIGLYTQTAIELEDARRALARHEKTAKALHIHLHALRARPGRTITTDFVRAVLERLIEHPDEVCALADPPEQALPDGFKAETCVTAQCAVCEYEFDEDESSTIHFEDVATAHKTLRGYDWTILTDGRAVCPADDSEHQQLRENTDTPSPPVSPDQTVLDVQDEDEEFEETGDSDSDVFELISEIAGRLRDATDEGEYHAVGLIGDLANGCMPVAEARAALAELTFRHV